MATQLWFGEINPALEVTGLIGPEWQFQADVTVGADTIRWVSSLVRGMRTTVGTNGTNSTGTISTVAGPTAGKILSPVSSGRLWISDPLAADVTISGTVSFAMCAFENSMSANAAIACAILRMQGDGTITTIISSADTVGELGTTLAKRSWTASPTSTACKKGDRLIFVPYIDDAGTMGSGFSVTFAWTGTTANIGDSNITFTENLTFLTSAPSGSSYYLRNTASDLAGSGQKALSTTQGSGTVTATYATVNGPVTAPGNRVTATGGGTQLEWFTPALDAFTLGGAVQIDLGCESVPASTAAGGGGQYFTYLEVAICDADGTNATRWAISYESGNFTGGVPGVISHFITGPDTAVAQGKRLRFRIYIDDNTLSTGANQVSGTNVVYRYDGTSTYAARLVFTQTITEAGPTADPPPTLFDSLRRKRRFNPLWIR